MDSNRLCTLFSLAVIFIKADTEILDPNAIQPLRLHILLDLGKEIFAKFKAPYSESQRVKKSIEQHYISKISIFNDCRILSFWAPTLVDFLSIVILRASSEF